MYFKAVESFPFEVPISSCVSLTQIVTELNWNLSGTVPRTFSWSWFSTVYLLWAIYCIHQTPPRLPQQVSRETKIQEFFNVQ